MSQQHTPKMLRQRKFLLVLPVLILPFLTLGFWALGGGKASSGASTGSDQAAGLNLELPGAHIKDEPSVDKLGYYEKADADSARLQELMQHDPYFKRDSFATVLAPSQPSLSTPAASSSFADPNEARVYQKLAQLNSVLQEPPAVKSDSPPMEQYAIPHPENSSAADPEVKQLDGMLDKILDIQHPERMQEKRPSPPVNGKEQIFAVQRNDATAGLSLLDTSARKKKSADNGFYGWNKPADGVFRNTIEAVVHESQTLVNGATIKMRLLNDVSINGHLVVRDNFIYGTAVLNNERLEIAISSIREAQALFPVQLEVYDMDGLPGIYIPGAITRDVSKQSTDNALQSVALNSLDPSIGAQAASAGIEAAKTLLSKKIKLIRVQVKAGYRILLRDKN